MLANSAFHLSLFTFHFSPLLGRSPPTPIVCPAPDPPDFWILAPAFAGLKLARPGTLAALLVALIRILVLIVVLAFARFLSNVLK
jgi:hypothetical protein